MRKFSWILIAVVMLALGLSVGRLSAGSPDSPGAPNSPAAQMYTLEQIYQRLSSGAAGTQMTTFTEPGTEPGTGTMHTLNDIMAQAPAQDNVNGVSTANVLIGKTFWGLTSGQWGLRTGTAPAAGVPKTGQSPTVPINPAPTGSDGALQKGVAWPNPRFTDNSNGTVTDNLTGLIWLRNANCTDTVGGVIKSSETLTWTKALTWSNSLAAGKCGLTDGSTAGQWRLPNVREMQSLVHYGVSSPAVPNTAGTGQWAAGDPFDNVQSNYYWSSSTYALFPTGAWSVYLFDGVVNGSDKTFATLYVWPVRGGQ